MTEVGDWFIRNQALQRQIKLVQIFIKLLVSVLRVRRLKIIFMLRVVPTLTNRHITQSGVVQRASKRGYSLLVTSYFQITPYSRWTSFTGLVGFSDNMNRTPTSQCDFMIDLAVDRLCGVVSLCHRVTRQCYQDNILMLLVSHLLDVWVDVLFLMTTMSMLTMYELSMLTSSSITPIKCHGQQ